MSNYMDNNINGSLLPLCQSYSLQLYTYCLNHHAIDTIMYYTFYIFI